MATQVVAGWPKMKDGLRRFFRSSANPGLVDDYTIADALTEAESALSDLVIESGVGWLIKSVEVDDVGSSLGVAYGQNGRFLLVEQDLGLTDFCRIKKLYRKQADTGGLLGLNYLGNDNDAASLADPAWIGGRAGAESWIESGGLNTAGRHEPGIRIINWNTLSVNAPLVVDYWFTPPDVDVDWFTETDASGDLTRRPSLPRQMDYFILNYAKLVIAEQTGDIAKLRALQNRFNGRGGILERVRGQLNTFQSEDSEYVQDVFSRE